MALAPYFEKAALSAASLVQGFEISAFKNLVEKQRPAIAFDGTAAKSPEGRLTLEMLTNLSARLYPTLVIALVGTPTSEGSELLDRLSQIAEEINSSIEIQSTESFTQFDAAVVVGSTQVPATTPTIYVGSSGWVVFTSTKAPVGCGSSTLPFAAGAAACFGAAALFRMLFGQQLSAADGNALVSDEGVSGLHEDSLTLSLLTMQVGDATGSEAESLPTTATTIGESTLVGVGAIGNSAVWAIARTPFITGVLNLVDHELIELGNLQRYALAGMRDVGCSKVQLAAKHFETHRASANGISVLPVRDTWANYVATKADYTFDRVLVALDSAEDRLTVQASLPRWVVNSWTQPENLGISRHPDFTHGACLACLYIPTSPRPSKDVLIFQALQARGQQELMEVRARLHDGKPVGEVFLRRTAERLGVPFEPIADFSARPLEDFYIQALCGGLVLKLGGGHDVAHQVEVPMAFQSALAGILLAAELVIDCAELREGELPCRTEVNLLRRLGGHLNIPTAKHNSGRCLCQDDMFVRAYLRKYRGAGSPKN